MTKDDRLHFLRQISGFDELPESDLHALVQRVSKPKLPRGTVLAREGEVADSAFQLVGGIVHQTRTRPGGDERLSTFLTGGELLCDRALRSAQAEAATAIAYTDIELYALARRDFEDVMRDRPALAVALIRALAAKLERLAVSSPVHAVVPPTPGSRIIPLVAMSAGTGRTTLGVNLSAAIAQITGGRVLLIDPSLTGRGIASALGISSDADYVDALLKGTAWDVQRALWRTKGEFWTPLPPRRRGASLAEAHLTTAFHAFCEHFDTVIVDSSSVMANLNRAVLRSAERIVLVSSAHDAADIDLAQFQRSVLSGSTVRPERMIVAVNQAPSGTEPGPDRISIPRATDLIAGCASKNALPYREAPDAPFSRAIRELALRVAFDHRLKVALPQPWPAAAGPEVAAGRLREFLGSRFAHVDDAGTTAVQAWATQPKLSAHLAETVDFLGAIKGELALPYLCLEINGKPNLI